MVRYKKIILHCTKLIIISTTSNLTFYNFTDIQYVCLVADFADRIGNYKESGIPSTTYKYNPVLMESLFHKA